MLAARITSTHWRRWLASIISMHDLEDGDQDRHVRRLVDLGATRVEDRPYPEDPDLVPLRDPDGSEFCIIDRAGLT